MESRILDELLTILALTLLNGVFSGAEIAILSIRKTRLSELVDEGNANARAILTLREQPERFLATVQIGITVVSATAAAYGGSSVAAALAPFVAMIPGLEEVAGKVAFGIVIALVSTLSLVLGELIPKSLALRRAETYAMLIGRPLQLLTTVAAPAVWFLTGASNLVLRFFNDRTNFTEGRLSREELQQLVDEAATAGSVGTQVSEIASRALDFDNLDASDVMVPRTDVSCVAITAQLSELVELARGKGHARVPVYEGNVDNVIGLLNLREVMARGSTEPNFDLRRYVHPVPFVHESMAAPAVLRELQTRRSHMALVVDEQGSLRGLVTIEDLVEELVGEIFSENDAPTPVIQKEADGSVIVQAATAVHEINRELGMELPEGETFSTIAGLCLYVAERIPAQGDVLEVEGYRLHIVDASPRRVRLVRVVRVPASEQQLDS